MAITTLPAFPELAEPVSEQVDAQLGGEEQRQAQVQLVAHVAQVRRPDRVLKFGVNLVLHIENGMRWHRRRGSGD